MVLTSSIRFSVILFLAVFLGALSPCRCGEPLIADNGGDPSKIKNAVSPDGRFRIRNNVKNRVHFEVVDKKGKPLYSAAEKLEGLFGVTATQAFWSPDSSCVAVPVSGTRQTQYPVLIRISGGKAKELELPAIECPGFDQVSLIPRRWLDAHTLVVHAVAATEHRAEGYFDTCRFDVNVKVSPKIGAVTEISRTPKIISRE